MTCSSANLKTVVGIEIIKRDVPYYIKDAENLRLGKKVFFTTLMIGWSVGVQNDSRETSG